MTRFPLALLIILAAVIPTNAGVKVAGSEFVPKDLIFASADSRSQASAEGSLPNECEWSFLFQTRIGRQEDSQRCVRFFFKTSVTLIKSCPVKEEPPVIRFAERVTATPNRCPDNTGRINTPGIDTTVISSGTTVDGKHQEILRQPDGTRIVLSYDHTMVTITAAFPDGTTDVLKLP